MSQLLDNPRKLLNGSNIIGRLTFGLVGLELKSKNDPNASEYIDSCISLYEDLDVGSIGSQLMTIFDYERPQKMGQVSEEFKKLEPLIKKANTKGNPLEIEEASSLIEKLLFDLHEIVGSRELKE